MPRNLDHRIEVLVPVENARVRQEIHAILDSAFADDDLGVAAAARTESGRRLAPGGPKAHSHHQAMMRRAPRSEARRRTRVRR